MDTQNNELASISDSEFKKLLAETIPHLRAFGRSLSGNIDTADDLVQEAMLKAWAARAKFKPGSNMRAWTFTILRNVFISQMRRNKFKGEYDELAAEKLLAAPAPQDAPLHLSDLQRGLMQLPDNQREAVILVGAGGFSYEEAAEICGCKVGTVKSRVSRAREALSVMVEHGNFGPNDKQNDQPAGEAFGAIMTELDEAVDDSKIAS